MVPNTLKKKKLINRFSIPQEFYTSYFCIPSRESNENEKQKKI
jgi:hypothetical protein